DGRLDLAVVDGANLTNEVSVLLGNGDGSFQPRTAYTAGLNGGYQPTAILAEDFTGDNRLDLAVLNHGSRDVSILLSNGDGTFRTAVAYPVSGGLEDVFPAGFVVGDFSSDGNLDLAVAETAGGFGLGGVCLLLGNGRGMFQPAEVVTTDINPFSIVA